MRQNRGPLQVSSVIVGWMTTWDPKQYLKFADHRLRPALDLLARIPPAEADIVWDLGCGAGNVTRLLKERWTEAETFGLDNSPEMLAKARTISGITWMEGDAATWAAPAPVDVIFSNAVFHWIPDHATIFPRLLAQLRPGGTLAVQMPRNFSAPSHVLLYETAREGPWAERLRPLLGPPPVASAEAYWRMLNPHARSVDVWESEYLHILSGDNAVVEWTKGTAVKPFLDALTPSLREPFLAAYGARIAKAYPLDTTGRTPFPFRRLFFVAIR